MRIEFSEVSPDYENYLSPYQVWAFLDDGETPVEAFSRGFLPGRYDFGHFYLARSVRVELDAFSEDRRARSVSRKFAGFDVVMVENTRQRWAEIHELAVKYLQTRGGTLNMKRVVSLTTSAMVTHFLLVRKDGNLVGCMGVHIDPRYQFGFCALLLFETDLLPAPIGTFVMQSSLLAVKNLGVPYCYLGTCYSTQAIYKTRFGGAQFFNGRSWSSSREELHYLVEQPTGRKTHLLEDPIYLQRFVGDPRYAIDH